MATELDNFVVYSQIGLSAATVLTSLALVWITAILAKHTRRMADNTSKPHVVVTLEPNRWSLMHFDMRVANTGNAPAYDIKIDFEPQLPSADARHGMPPPLQNISVLRPGNDLSSYVAEAEKILDNIYRVTVSWRSSPGGILETFSYELNLSSYKAYSQLGASDPAVQIAEQVKKIREDWQSIARGHRRIDVDVFTQADRAEAARIARERIELRRARRSDNDSPTESR